MRNIRELRPLLKGTGPSILRLMLIVLILEINHNAFLLGMTKDHFVPFTKSPGRVSIRLGSLIFRVKLLNWTIERSPIEGQSRIPTCNVMQDIRKSTEIAYLFSLTSRWIHITFKPYRQLKTSWKNRMLGITYVALLVTISFALSNLLSNWSCVFLC